MLECQSQGQNPTRGLHEPSEDDGKSGSPLQYLVNHRLRDIQSSQLKLTVGGKEIVVREKIRSAIHAVLSVKDFITTAVSSEPHAALAWAGVLVLLSVSSP